MLVEINFPRIGTQSYNNFQYYFIQKSVQKFCGDTEAIVAEW